MPCQQAFLNLSGQVGTLLFLQAFLQKTEHAHQNKRRFPFHECWLREISTEHEHGRGLTRVALRDQGLCYLCTGIDLFNQYFTAPIYVFQNLLVSMFHFEIVTGNV